MCHLVFFWGDAHTLSCSKIQVHYRTLHLSCQTYWTHTPILVQLYLSSAYQTQYLIHIGIKHEKNKTVLKIDWMNGWMEMNAWIVHFKLIPKSTPCIVKLQLQFPNVHDAFHCLSILRLFQRWKLNVTRNNTTKIVVVFLNLRCLKRKGG